MSKASTQGLIFTVHPFSRGFGWTLFEGPLAPVDWGIVQAKKDRNAKCLMRIERLLTRYQPSVIVLEQFDRRPARRAVRIKALCLAITQLGNHRGIEVRVYNRAVIRTCFVTSGARTRYEIASAIAALIDVFRHRLPRARKRWQSEDCRQSLFDAAALAITHFAVRGVAAP